MLSEISLDKCFTPFNGNIKTSQFYFVKLLKIALSFSEKVSQVNRHYSTLYIVLLLKLKGKESEDLAETETIVPVQRADNSLASLLQAST